ncbi:MAG TPA: hypothetical protein VK957_21585 [Lunatimonas sp.]|nr:hypothetical protein [Lunatimonas sp.]
MKILDIVMLPFAAALVIIGAHVTVQHGVGASYPIFMFAVATLFWFLLRKKRREENEPVESELPKKKEKRKR